MTEEKPQYKFTSKNALRRSIEKVMPNADEKIKRATFTSLKDRVGWRKTPTDKDGWPGDWIPPDHKMSSADRRKLI